MLRDGQDDFSGSLKRIKFTKIISNNKRLLETAIIQRYFFVNTNKVKNHARTISTFHD